MVFKKNLMFLTEFKVNVKLIFYAGNFECCTGFFFLILGIPYITDCVLGELEKLGQKFRVALRIIKDPRFERIHCMHQGTYADDCIVQRVTQV